MIADVTCLLKTVVQLQPERALSLVVEKNVIQSLCGLLGVLCDCGRDGVLGTLVWCIRTALIVVDAFLLL